jgi:hypothetical protein
MGISTAAARLLGVLNCRGCGIPFHRRADRAQQRYCGPSCSERADLKRKNVVKRERDGRSMGKEIGSAVSVANAQSITFSRPNPDLIWQTRIKVPFTYAASKNHIYSLRPNGHISLRKESSAFRDLIGFELKSALRLSASRVVHNKVWIDILVQKSNHKGDAINVVDLVCDAIKRVLPVDDRWFCIRSLDWEIVRDGGFIFIAIGQESDKDVQVCSYCGQIKTLDEFYPASGKHLGSGRECRSCLKAIWAKRREMRAAK